METSASTKRKVRRKNQAENGDNPTVRSLKTGNFQINVDPTRNIPKIGRLRSQTLRDYEHLEAAVKMTVESLPWRTNHDDAAISLALKLAKTLDQILLGSENKTYRPVDERFRNTNIRDLGDLLLKVLVELGATPMARTNLNAQQENEDDTNPVARFQNKRANRV